MTTCGAAQILGAGKAPLPLSETEMPSRQMAIASGLSVQPFSFLHVGQRIRISSGVMAGVEGIVMGFRQRLRLLLAITLLQRSVLLEIDRDQVGAARFN
jgi:transcription antitermination factor NusG